MDIRPLENAIEEYGIIEYMNTEDVFTLLLHIPKPIGIIKTTRLLSEIMEYFEGEYEKVETVFTNSTHLLIILTSK